CIYCRARSFFQELNRPPTNGWSFISQGMNGHGYRRQSIPPLPEKKCSNWNTAYCRKMAGLDGQALGQSLSSMKREKLWSGLASPAISRQEKFSKKNAIKIIYYYSNRN